ncbi:E3 ubiquitin-protein ligase MIB2-like isoform X1 [Pomacea canaliculata]|uniref:E3 ubiquitin-protein ligase MIB2-like isoform X1 n=1 Tax=Pomacea canaliculata TaxID=400727 RepID=UPI000D72DF70|nr:E3 ubiquitin-protein ligase MIB2-like isoform X1 [Pomacea canaliculata]
MSGDTPLLDALTMDNRGIADMLLALDSVDINHANNRDITALHAASVRGNCAAVERILARDKTNVNKRINGEISPLHLATNDNHVEVMRLLVINGGADVNIEAGGTREGYTPLHHACFKGHFEAVETLLELGAQVNVYTKLKESPLHLAMGSPLQIDSEEFHDDPILRTRTQIACLLITNGAFVDVEDNMGRPPTRYGLQEVRAAVQHFMDANRHFVRKRGRERRDGGEDFSVLRGVALTCGLCRNAVSDITLLPCGHKTVCRGCSGHVVQCPVCHYRVDRTTDDDKAGSLFEAISSRW